MKPIIGVMPLWDDEKESIWMLPGYMDGIQHAGGIPVVLSFSTDEGMTYPQNYTMKSQWMD